MSAPRRARRAPGSGDPRSGQSLVEFALVVPFLLLLVIGLVEFGRAWNAYQVITDAAREAARTAVVSNWNPLVTQDSVIAVARDALGRAGLDASAAQIVPTGVGGARGTPATVAISYPYDFVFLRPLMGWLDADGLVTLKTSFSMRNE